MDASLRVGFEPTTSNRPGGALPDCATAESPGWPHHSEPEQNARRARLAVCPQRRVTWRRRHAFCSKVTSAVSRCSKEALRYHSRQPRCHLSTNAMRRGLTQHQTVPLGIRLGLRGVARLWPVNHHPPASGALFSFSAEQVAFSLWRFVIVRRIGSHSSANATNHAASRRVIGSASRAKRSAMMLSSVSSSYAFESSGRSG